MFFTIWRRWLSKRNKKTGRAVTAACQGILSACRMFGSPSVRKRYVQGTVSKLKVHELSVIKQKVSQTLLIRKLLAFR